MPSNIISIIYSTLYFVLSAAMFVVLVPQKEQFQDYKKARKTMGTAFMLIGLFGLYRSTVTAPPGKSHIIFCIICLLSLVFATLNFLGFLYISETSNARIRKVFRGFLLGAAIITTCSIAGAFIEEIAFISRIINISTYGIITCYIFVQSLMEYRKCSNRINSYYSNHTWDISWMHVLLWITFILAMAMIAAFYIYNIRTYIGFASMLFYTYLTFKVLSFVPATIDNVRHETSLAETEEEEHKIEEARTPSVKVMSEYSKKIEPLLQEWVESGHYMKASITIRDVATEMGTNHNYLSTYLNKVKETSFTTWLNSLRIEKSKEYLSSSERYSIEECGIMVGIPEPYNFSRWFKTITGMTPAAYRKGLRSK